MTQERSRALVLGGGGVTGIAWEVGVLAGLAESGFDVRDWDLVVGTSAGAIAGARLLGDADLAGWYATMAAPWSREDDQPVRDVGGRVAAAAMRLGRRRLLNWTVQAWFTALAIETLVRQRAVRGKRASVPHPTPVAGLRPFREADWMAARAGAFSLAARTSTEEVYLAAVSSYLGPVTAWPDALVVTMVDALDGRAVAADARSGVPLVRAVAASCAVPALMPPVTIGGRPYVDGGVVSQSHLVLAAGYDDVLVIAPIDLGSLASEAADLRGSGSRVRVIQPSVEAAESIGRDVRVLDMARRSRSARLGREEGRQAAMLLVAEMPGRRGREALPRTAAG